MRAIIHRLWRLEHAAAPAEQERTAAELMSENRRRRLGPDYKPTEFPPGWFDGCRGVADHILRARRFEVEQRANGASSRDEEPSQNTSR